MAVTDRSTSTTAPRADDETPSDSRTPSANGDAGLRQLAMGLIMDARRWMGSAGAFDATEDALESLAMITVPLFGEAGFRLLLTSALDAVRERDPGAVGPVRVGAEGEAFIVGIAASGAGWDAVGAMVLDQLLVLMARFIGADMTIGIVHDAFPQVRPGDFRLEAAERNEAAELFPFGFPIPSA